MLKLSCTQLVSSLVIQSLLGTFTSNLFRFKQPPLSGKCLNFRSYRDKTGKLRTLVDAFRPLYPVFGMFVISTLWLLFSPNNIMTVDPRMFIMVTGTIFSNISVLFLEQMLPLEHHNNFLSLSFQFPRVAWLSHRWATLDVITGIHNWPSTCLQFSSAFFHFNNVASHNYHLMLNYGYSGR